VLCAGSVVHVGVHTYNSSGTYYDTLTAYTGCDSVVQTNLTILPASSTVSSSVTLCAGDSTFFRGTYYHSAGTVRDTVANYIGCDSIIYALTISIAPNHTWYLDADHDSYGNAAITKDSCSTPFGYVADSTDCNDADASEHALHTYYVDADHDGHGAGSAVILCAAVAPFGYAAVNDDCDDHDSTFISIPPVSLELTMYDTICYVKGRRVHLSGGSPGGGYYTGLGVNQGLFWEDSAHIGMNIITYHYQERGCTGEASDTVWMFYCSGIDESNLQSVIELYPNPAENEVFIDFKGLSAGELNIKLYNDLGQIVFDQMYNLEDTKESRIALDIWKYASGVYFANITHSKGTVVKKFVKR
jgi:hypothetical protein